MKTILTCFWIIRNIALAVVFLASPAPAKTKARPKGDEAVAPVANAPLTVTVAPEHVKSRWTDSWRAYAVAAAAVTAAVVVAVSATLVSQANNARNSVLTSPAASASPAQDRIVEPSTAPSAVVSQESATPEASSSPEAPSDTVTAPPEGAASAP